MLGVGAPHETLVVSLPSSVIARLTCSAYYPRELVNFHGKVLGIPGQRATLSTRGRRIQPKSDISLRVDHGPQHAEKVTPFVNDC